MHILVGSDHFGYNLKIAIKEHLLELGHEVVDLGCDDAQTPVNYPDVAVAVAERIATGACTRGILICGTGIGMAIAANKVPGVRAACCHDPYSAERARKSNDAQIMTLGSQVVAPALACMLVDHWLSAEFAGGRSTAKVAKLAALDQRYRRAVQAEDL